jgi:KUP system potassium uptake protein
MESPPTTPLPRRRLVLLSLAALGVVYGDIGTSPLYALRECFSGEFGIGVTPKNVLGVLSLIFWALMLVVSFKYLHWVLRVDNDGEGGVLALTALLRRKVNGNPTHLGLLFGLGLFGAALLYGDAMITTSISVLSAVEGLGTLDASLAHFVVPVTLAILISLFAIQSNGTARVGAIFGPVTLVWFTTIGFLGASWVARAPEVLQAVNPWHAVAFFAHHGAAGYLVLAGVFLCVTGAEALYADMGHFGARPIRLAWWSVVLPGLLLCYFGQGALLLRYPEHAGNPFFSLAPDWLLVPLIVLATLATVVASQAVISGAFSLTRQAIRLGLLPRMHVVHTSATEFGQVYVPQVNWLLMLATVGLVVWFRTSGALAAAYGVAVTSTMLITTILFAVIAAQRFGWRLSRLVPLVGLFLAIDVAFVGANATKLLHGAWFAIGVGFLIFAIMTTWRKARILLGQALRATLPRMEDFVRVTHDVPRVEGMAVFLTSDPDCVPSSILHNLKHNRVLHSRTAFLNIATDRVPRVSSEEKVRVHDLGSGFYRITARYGFYETPSVPNVLALAQSQGLELPVERVSFFLARQRLVPRRTRQMSLWGQRLYAFLSRNSLGATSFYGVPSGQVVEIGAHVHLQDPRTLADDRALREGRASTAASEALDRAVRR